MLDGPTLGQMSIMMPQDFPQTSPFRVLADPDVALLSAFGTLTSAVQDLTEKVQALQARRPFASQPNDVRSWAVPGHRPERSTRPRRVPSRSQGSHP